MSFSPKWRQVAVAASTQLAAFSVGGAVSYPTILLEQFGVNDTTTLDLDTRSWMGSIHGLAGISAIFMPIIAQRYGRKIGFILSSLMFTIGWILAFTAKTAAQILLSESFHGLGTNSIAIVGNMCITEMLSPKSRHISLQMFTLLFYIGITVVGILAFWVQSPYWLACKGEFEKCESTFIKLRGNDKDSMRELNELIIAQAENLSNVNRKKHVTFRGIWIKISSRDFYMSSFHTLIMFLVLYFSGGSVVVIYYIDIVRKTTNNEKFTNYSGIAMYVVSFLGSIATIYLASRFKNKTIILSNGFVKMICLIGCVMVTSFQSFGILAKDSYLLAYFMIGIAASKGFGTIYLVAGEIIPVRHRNIGGALYVIYNSTLSTTVLKLSPYLFLFIGYSGTFLIYTISLLLGTLFIWKYVPETKGRTLQELENYYMHGSFVKKCSDIAEKSKSQELCPLGKSL